MFDILLANSYIYLWASCADIHFNTGPALNDGLWHSIAITYDGAGTVALYIDHVLIRAVTSFTNSCDGNQAFPIQYNTMGDNNVLGKTNSAHADQFPYFTGYLQNIVFYDYAQSASAAASDIVPMASPTITPSTVTPSFRPIVAPSSGPTATPTTGPTVAPSSGPTATPTTGPTATPTTGRTTSPSFTVAPSVITSTLSGVSE